MITFEAKNDFKNTNKLFNRLRSKAKIVDLDRIGQMGVDALRDATPVQTGETASSWYYTIDREQDYATITWCNSNVVDGANVAVLLQYGHATRNGSWVEGIDFINPALKPVFDEIAQTAWREVTK